MKKATSIIMGAAVVLLSTSMAFAVTTNGIKKSKHDLSFLNTSTVVRDTQASQTQICIYCHTPHNASDTNLLWNRTNNNITAAGSFKMYSSTTVSSTVKAVKTLSVGDTSYKCLTCHDGSLTNMKANTVVGNTSLDDVTGNAEWNGTYKIGAAPHLSGAPTQGDLRDDHPIAFNYKTAVGGNNGYHTDIEVETAIGTGVVSIGKSAFDASGKMQCGTCHYVHNEGSNRFLLRATPDGSQLCLTCHKK